MLDIELFVSGRHSEAIAPVLTAKAFASERGERWIVATCARRLAWSYDFSGDDVAAIESLDEAAQEFEALKDRAAVARCLNSKGVLWTRRGDREESLRVLRALQNRLLELLEDPLKFGWRHRPGDELLKQLG